MTAPHRRDRVARVRAAVLACVGVLTLCTLLASVVLGVPAPRAAQAAQAAQAAETATGAPSTTAPATTPATAEPTTEPTTAPTTEPTGEPEPTAPPTTGAVTVDDAVLRWGLTNESNNAAHEPGAHNFLAAGRAVPGVGAHLRERQWTATDGDVAIEKWDGSSWRTATWAGLRTTSAGAPITNPGAGTFSNHQVVLRAGEGTVDRTAGTARIAWTGTFTVLYYSGRSFFHVSDPVLSVADGRGTLTGTVTGYASSRDDPTQREPVAPREVSLADLPAVDLDDVTGFSATPAYRGVRVSGTAQRTDVADAGSFPQSFVTLMEELGTGAFWYSSGAATDAFKVALPVTVAYDASTPVAGPQPAPGPTTAVPVPENTALAPPTRPADVAPRPAVPRSAGAPAPTTARALTVPAAAAVAALDQLGFGYDLQSVSAVTARDEPAAAGATSALWWVGGGLLLAAAALLAVPAHRLPGPLARSRRSGGARPIPPPV
ncbi:hypothetical protein ACOACO_10110 [Nocardioides sp. CPCC 205120]|uniref:hypothetical protein n=1 Tax=Nocardioides sp. CPCC 205120 TaxID=3406462 RepID=UPI003B514789